MEENRVNSKLVLFTLVLVLIALLLLNFLFSNSRKDPVWNYDKIETAENVKYLGEITTDREVYYNLETIVVDYLNSFTDKDAEITYEDYYGVLTDEYKKYLGKSGYEKVAKGFLNKFIRGEIGENVEVDTNQLLKAVYSFDNNIYLCELQSNSIGQKAYIAIGLYSNQREFGIVYIE